MCSLFYFSSKHRRRRRWQAFRWRFMLMLMCVFVYAAVFMMHASQSASMILALHRLYAYICERMCHMQMKTFERKQSTYCDYVCALPIARPMFVFFTLINETILIHFTLICYSHIILVPCCVSQTHFHRMSYGDANEQAAYNEDCWRECQSEMKIHYRISHLHLLMANPCDTTECCS